MVQKTVEVNPSASSAVFVSVATALPVRGWLDVIRFFRMNSKVEAQLRKSEGLVRYALRTDFPHKRFWTLSVWTDRDAVRRFVTAEPHLTALRSFAKWAAPGAAFVEWEDSDGRADWGVAMKRLEASTRRYAQQ
jgi:quinol monooxygenase YgiN